MTSTRKVVALPLPFLTSPTQARPEGKELETLTRVLGDACVVVLVVVDGKRRQAPASGACG
jgi:hypothetical protein